MGEEAEFRLYYDRTKEDWTVIHAGREYHAAKVRILVEVETVIKSPRAWIEGRGRLNFNGTTLIIE